MEKRGKWALLKIGIVVFVFVLTAAVIFACEKQETEKEEQLKQTAADAAGIMIHLYYSDQNAEFIINKKIKISEIDPENLIEALIGQEVLEQGTEVLSFVRRKQENQELLDVDFNEKFREKLLSLGTSGERIFMGSVINTFLDAYNADGIKITVEGQTLESGHAIYDNYQNFYGQVQQRINVNYEEKGKQETVEVLKIYSDLGFATAYDEQTFAHVESLKENEFLFYDLKSKEEGQEKGSMKVVRLEQNMQSAVADIQTEKPWAVLESTSKVFGKEEEAGSFFTYTEREKEQERKGNIYICEHNGAVYRIEISCEEGENHLWGQLQMMVDEFYFVD